jgi:hypothetical protein
VPCRFQVVQIRYGGEHIQKEKLKATPFVYFSTWPNKTLISKAYKDTIQEYHRKGTNFDSLKEKLALIVAYWTSYLHPNSF